MNSANNILGTSALLLCLLCPQNLMLIVPIVSKYSVKHIELRYGLVAL
jgi:hypothetical protein